MKFISILLLFCAAVSAVPKNQETNQWCIGSHLRAAIRKCAGAYKASKADVADYIFLRWAANENAKCFRACIFNECRTFSPEGTIKFDVPKLSALLVSRKDAWKQSIAGNVAHNCLYVIPKGSNRCDHTEAYLRCLTANSPVKLNLIGAV